VSADTSNATPMTTPADFERRPQTKLLQVSKVIASADAGKEKARADR